MSLALNGSEMRVGGGWGGVARCINIVSKICLLIEELLPTFVMFARQAVHQWNKNVIHNISPSKYWILVGFGRACAPVRCAHPSFRVHCHAKRGAARPHPAIAASLLLIRPPKIFTFYQTWDAHVKGFFLSTGPQRLWNKKSSSLLFLFLFFLFFSSYPSLLISSYTSRCDHAS